MAGWGVFWNSFPVPPREYEYVCHYLEGYGLDRIGSAAVVPPPDLFLVGAGRLWTTDKVAGQHQNTVAERNDAARFLSSGSPHVVENCCRVSLVCRGDERSWSQSVGGLFHSLAPVQTVRRNLRLNTDCVSFG